MHIPRIYDKTHMRIYNFVQGGEIMGDWVQIIQNVGFPIAAFCLMWYQGNTTIKECTQAINNLTLHLKYTEEYTE